MPLALCFVLDRWLPSNMDSGINLDGLPSRGFLHSSFVGHLCPSMTLPSFPHAPHLSQEGPGAQSFKYGQSPANDQVLTPCQSLGTREGTEEWRAVPLASGRGSKVTGR